MMRLTQRIIGQALFSIDLSNETDTVGQAIATANRLFSYYLYAPFVAMGIPTPRNLRFRAAIRRLDEVVQNMINELATLAQQYQLCLVPGHPVEPMGAITLVPRHGLRMTLHRR